MVHLDKEISLIVNAGECEDVVDHDQGFVSIEARFLPGLAIPVITLAFNLTDQADVRCFKQGEPATLIFGVESGDVYITGTVLKTRVVSTTQHYGLKVAVAVGTDFTNDFLKFYLKGTSTDALSSILGNYFPITNDAASPSDTMTWMGYGIAKRLALNVWLRSSYGGSNYLLAGIDHEGARLIDVATASGSKKWKLGSEPGDDAIIDSLLIENRRPLVQDGLDRDIVSDTLIGPVNYGEHSGKPNPYLVSSVKDWRKAKRRIVEAQYSDDGPVHADWSNALASNGAYLSILRPVVRVSYFGFLPIRMFDAVDLNVKDIYPQMELGGRYLIGDITFTAANGRFQTILGLMREEVSL